MSSPPGCAQATSSLDEVNQKLVVDALSVLMKGEGGEGEGMSLRRLAGRELAHLPTDPLTDSLTDSLAPPVSQAEHALPSRTVCPRFAA